MWTSGYIASHSVNLLYICVRLLQLTGSQISCIYAIPASSNYAASKALADKACTPKEFACETEYETAEFTLSLAGRRLFGESPGACLS